MKILESSLVDWQLCGFETVEECSAFKTYINFIGLSERGYYNNETKIVFSIKPLKVYIRKDIVKDLVEEFNKIEI